MIDIENIKAIDVHVHAELSCTQPHDDYRSELDAAFAKYFKIDKRPTIQETADFFREQILAFVMFTFYGEHEVGKKRIPNIEEAECTIKNHDVMIAFESIDPHQGKMGAREASVLIQNYEAKGFKFHPTVQGFYPYDKMTYHIDQVIAEYNLLILLRTVHAGFGNGVPSGGGLRLEYSNPMHLDDVSIDFPDCPIIMVPLSKPWHYEAFSMAMHKPNVYIGLSGWSPKYFPKQMVQYANKVLGDRILFGTDFPLITLESWVKDFEDAGFKVEV